MGKLAGLLAVIVILLLLCTGIFTNLVNFFGWLFLLQYSQPETTVFGGITVRILTFLISYALVGVIFTALDWYDSKIMSVSYFVISTLLGFILAYIVWCIEKYILIICIVMGVLLILAIVAIVVLVILNKKRTKEIQGK